MGKIYGRFFQLDTAGFVAAAAAQAGFVRLLHHEDVMEHEDRPALQHAMGIHGAKTWAKPLVDDNKKVVLNRMLIMKLWGYDREYR